MEEPSRAIVKPCCVLLDRREVFRYYAQTRARRRGGSKRSRAADVCSPPALGDLSKPSPSGGNKKLRAACQPFEAIYIRVTDNAELVSEDIKPEVESSGEVDIKEEPPELTSSDDDWNGCVGLQAPSSRDLASSEMLANEENHSVPLKCNLCDRFCETKSDYDTHQGIHKKGLQDVCPYCKEEVNNFCSLQLHVMKFHSAFGVSQTPNITFNGKNAFKCPICLGIFTEPNVFFSHCFPYTNFPSLRYYCVKCDVSFSMFQSLLAHSLKLHNTSDCFQCRYCQDSFKNYDTLCSHIKSEHNVKMIHCKNCCTDINKNCYKHCHLKYCCLGFECPFCTERFSQEMFQSHVSSHFVNFKFICKICTNVFPSKHNIKCHIVKIHSNFKIDDIESQIIDISVKFIFSQNLAVSLMTLLKKACSPQVMGQKLLMPPDRNTECNSGKKQLSVGNEANSVSVLTQTEPGSSVAEVHPGVTEPGSSVAKVHPGVAVANSVGTLTQTEPGPSVAKIHPWVTVANSVGTLTQTEPGPSVVKLHPGVTEPGPSVAKLHPGVQIVFKCEFCSQNFMSGNLLKEHYTKYHRKLDVKLCGEECRCYFLPLRNNKLGNELVTPLSKNINISSSSCLCVKPQHINIPRKTAEKGAYMTKMCQLPPNTNQPTNRTAENIQNTCKQCGKKFNNSCNLTMHRNKYHTISTEDIKDPEVTVQGTKIFECPVCLSLFPEPHLFYLHCFPYSSFFPSLVYQCSFCHVKLNNSLEFFQHCDSSHGASNQTLPCRICDERFTYDTLTSHIETEHCGVYIHCKACCQDVQTDAFLHHISDTCTQSNNICPFCVDICEDRKALSKHICRHQQDKNLKPEFCCKICLKYFYSVHNIMHHIHMKHSNSKICCHGEKEHEGKCDGEFYVMKCSENNVSLAKRETEETGTKLVVHECCNSDPANIEVRETFENIEYHCLTPTCELKFYNACSLQIHSMVSHKYLNMKHPVQFVSGRKVYKCPVCLSEFTEETLFYLHCFPYTVFSSYLRICYICNVMFRSTVKLAKHFDIQHKGRHLYRCEICQLKCNHLSDHITECHFGKFVFCETCKRQFTLDSYKDHLNICKSQCSLCSDQLKTSVVNRHFKTHILNLEYIFCCKICLRYFLSQKNIKLHISHDHSNIKLIEADSHILMQPINRVNKS